MSNENNIPDIKPDHLGISVPDMDASLAWYQRVLGFELEFRVYLDIIPAHVAFIQRGKFRIELFQLEQAKPLPEERRMPNTDLLTHGNKHICFGVQDMETMLQHLRKEEADIVFTKVIQGTPTTFLRDNSGNLIEMIELPHLWD
ncbi:VOC family protein [Oceanobacter mangrovi]|uniref:VOC family protein n=1 Tax=Oceanobacter mangrovi TaxID=2862510 RepID=UPI001C8E7A18|nr:VOC family protein [Oceanobacter mangrovi]